MVVERVSYKKARVEVITARCMSLLYMSKFSRSRSKCVDSRLQFPISANIRFRSKSFPPRFQGLMVMSRLVLLS